MTKLEGKEKNTGNQHLWSLDPILRDHGRFLYYCGWRAGLNRTYWGCNKREYHGMTIQATTFVEIGWKKERAPPAAGLGVGVLKLVELEAAVLFWGELKAKDGGVEDSDAENLWGKTNKHIYIDII